MSGVVIRTENQSVYTIEKIPGSSFKYFSNIKFNNGNKLLIEDPGMISIGSPFAFRFVDDYRNGPLAGKCVETSPIASMDSIFDCDSSHTVESQTEVLTQPSYW